ncbi:MAG: HU family DNA-binding protein [Candidatus Kapabacteria bacterium]|nr:HU family DNA-binding protein [Candidatus Kapabacteria bacterium]
MSLNKTQLISAIAGNTGMTKVDSEKALKSAISAITAELAAMGNVTLIGFGTFSVYERAARIGKDPRTGATIKIPAKKVAKFKPGKALAELVAVKKKEKGKKDTKAAAKGKKK